MIRLDENGGCEFDGFYGFYYTKDCITDIRRIQNVLFEKENIIASLEECINIWERYSSDLSASWLFLPDDDEDILVYIKSSDYFDSFENYCL